MSIGRFATAINCIDGRAQIPVLDWLRLHCNVDYVDMITEPGTDQILAQGQVEAVAAIRKKVRFSIEAHQSRVIAVVGHHDCLAHPVSRDEHWEAIRESVRKVNAWALSARTLGLWVNEWGSVDLVCDTEERHAMSYL